MPDQFLLQLLPHPDSTMLPGVFWKTLPTVWLLSSPWCWWHLYTPATLLYLESSQFCPANDSLSSPDVPEVSIHHPFPETLSYRWKKSLYWSAPYRLPAFLSLHLSGHHNSYGYKLSGLHRFLSDSSNCQKFHLTWHPPQISGCTWNMSSFFPLL